jgi:hypothetical protein
MAAEPRQLKKNVGLSRDYKVTKLCDRTGIRATNKENH